MLLVKLITVVVAEALDKNKSKQKQAIDLYEIQGLNL